MKDYKIFVINISEKRWKKYENDKSRDFNAWKIIFKRMAGKNTHCFNGSFPAGCVDLFEIFRQTAVNHVFFRNVCVVFLPFCRFAYWFQRLLFRTEG